MVPDELSTEPVTHGQEPVDNLEGRCWLGTVLPKRHARRSVTRSLLKRQMRQAAARALPQLPAGLWLLRLSRPFAAAEFVSAASPALKRAARTELDALLQQAIARPRAR